MIFSPFSINISFIFCIFKIIFIRVQLIYNVVLVSGVQHGDSVIRIHVSILFPYRPLQSIE